MKHDGQDGGSGVRQGLAEFIHPGSNRLVPDLIDSLRIADCGFRTLDQGHRTKEPKAI